LTETSVAKSDAVISEDGLYQYQDRSSISQSKSGLL